MEQAAYFAVARVKKPHGLKGEVVVWPLTDRPGAVLEAGSELTPLDDAGVPIGAAVTIERSRPYHRQWLLKFRGLDDREGLERGGLGLLGVPAARLEGPANDELYRHEIPGAEVVADGHVLGCATGLIDVPGGALLAVNVAGREVLVPFRWPIVQGIDRATRRITIDPPAGLFEV